MYSRTDLASHDSRINIFCNDIISPHSSTAIIKLKSINYGTEKNLKFLPLSQPELPNTRLNHCTYYGYKILCNIYKWYGTCTKI